MSINFGYWASQGFLTVLKFLGFSLDPVKIQKIPCFFFFFFHKLFCANLHFYFLKKVKVKEESEKIGLKLNIQKTKIMASGSITSWEIDGETVETVSDFIFWGLQNHCRW